MKKTIILMLALVMALSFCVSAQAFTSGGSTAPSAANYIVAIRLIEAESGPIGVNFTAPAANRKYMKNEIVCAIATLHVPKGQDVVESGFEYLAFSGVNLSLNVMENFEGSNVSLLASSNIPQGSRVFTTGPNGLAVSNEIRFDAANIPVNMSSNQDYHFAFFGKILTDNAYVNVLLTKAKEFSAIVGGSKEETYANSVSLNATTEYLIFNKDYYVFKTVIDDNIWYVGANSALTRTLFKLSTTKSGKSENMQILLDGGTEWYDVVAMSDGKPAFRSVSGTDFVMESDTGAPKTRFNSLIAVYDDVISGAFGLDVRYKGNSLTPDYFTNFGKANDLFAEVAVEPWYAEVEIPPELEITPPKTGDKVSHVGFMLIALFGIALITLRKVKA